MEPMVQRRWSSRVGPDEVRSSKQESKQLTNEYIDDIWFKSSQELSLEVDALKVHIDSPKNIKTIRGHNLLGSRKQMGVAELVEG